MNRVSILRTLGAGLGAALLFGTLAAPADATSRAATSRTLAITPSGPSTQNDILLPLTGSSTTLVYSRQPYTAGDYDLAGPSGGQASGPVTLVARSASGHSVSLGTLPTQLELDGDVLKRFSLVGSVLTAGVYDYQEQSQTARVVYVWNIKTGERTKVTLTKGDSYLSAGPGGIVYSGAKGTVKLRTVTGKTTTLGSPFGATTRALFLGAADGAGEVVSDGLKADYVEFAAPHTVTPLDSNFSTGHGSGIDSLVCNAVADSYAACTDDYFDEGYEADAMVLLPLDGSAATVPSATSDLGDVALSGSNMVYTQETGNTSPPSYATFSQAAGSSSATPVGSPNGYLLTSAYGDAIATSPDESTLLKVTPDNQVSTVVPAVPSPITANAFALSSHKIVYVDDLRVPSRPGQVESVFSRSLSSHGSKLRASAPKLLSTGDNIVTGILAGASDSVSVYADDPAATPSYTTLLTNLEVVSAGRTRRIGPVDEQAGIQVVGNDVLYWRRVQGSTPYATRLEVFNAATKKTTVVSDGKARQHHIASAVPWGKYVAFSVRDGAVYRMNLHTGKKVRLAAPIKHHGITYVSVYEYGKWVAWQASAGSLPHGSSKTFNRIRNMKTMKPATSLGHTLYSLSSAGALLDSSFTAQVDPLDQMGTGTRQTRFWLRRYSGHTKPLLSKRAYANGPQLAGKVLAWVAADGVLRAKRTTG